MLLEAPGNRIRVGAVGGRWGPPARGWRQGVAGPGDADAAVAAHFDLSHAVCGGGGVDKLVEGRDPLADANRGQLGAFGGEVLDVDEEHGCLRIEERSWILGR